MIEQDAVRGEHVVGLAVVAGNVKRVGLGGCVGAARIERRQFSLWTLHHLAEQFGGRGLVKRASRPSSRIASSNRTAPTPTTSAGVLGNFEGNLDVDRRTEVVDLVRAHGFEDSGFREEASVEIPIDQVEPFALFPTAARTDGRYATW